MRRLLGIGSTLALGLAAVVAAPAAPASAALAPCFDYSTAAFSIGGPDPFVTWTDRPSIVRKNNIYPPNTDCRLRINDGGAGVLILQIALKTCNGYTYLATDADYGPQTRDAVAWQQGSKGIKVDGEYGPQTRDHMRWPVYTQTKKGKSMECQ